MLVTQRRMRRPLALLCTDKQPGQVKVNMGSMDFVLMRKAAQASGSGHGQIHWPKCYVEGGRGQYYMATEDENGHPEQSNSACFTHPSQGREKKLNAMCLITTSLQAPVRAGAARLAATFPPAPSADSLRLPCITFTPRGNGTQVPPMENVRPGTQGKSKDSAAVARLKCKSCLCYRLCDPGQVEVSISFSTQ